MRINKLLTNGYELTEEEKANLKVTLQDVIGEIQSEEGYWRPFVNGTNGNLYWEWDTSPTGNTPAQRKILYWPAFSADPENSHLLWKLDDDESWTDLNITTSGARGPQGDPGQKGADGTSVRLVGTETVAGGTQVTLGWGTSDTSAFVIPSGAAGANGTNGTNGVSPTVTITDAPTTEHPQGGKTVTITDADHPTGQSFDIWNGIDGQGATVNLVEGNGIQITHEAGTTNYTIGVSADYALKSDISDMATKTWVGQRGYLTQSDLDSYATKTYANEASAYALSQAESWVETEGYLKAVPAEYATKTYANEASAYALSEAKTWVEDQDYLPTSGGTVSGQLVVSGGSTFDQQFLKIIREGVNGYARIGIGQSGPLALKVDDSNGHTTQVNISPNASNDQLVQVQHGGTTLYLIPAQIHQGSYTPTADGILHIILESES